MISAVYEKAFKKEKLQLFLQRLSTIWRQLASPKDDAMFANQFYIKFSLNNFSFYVDHNDLHQSNTDIICLII